MGLFNKIFKKKPEPVRQPTPDPAAEKTKPMAAEPPALEKKKRTSWIDELSDPASPAHEKLAQLPNAPELKPEPVAEIGVTVTFRHERTEHKPAGELSHLDFGRPAGELGCFLNYEPRVLREPSEKQLAYLKDLGVFIPDGITNVDASCMISRVTGEDDPEGPGPELVALAAGLGTQFSAFISAAGLLRAIVEQAGEKERVALYVYGVRQSLHGVAFGNMLEDPEAGVFYSFADRVVTDPALLRSLNGRAAEDYLHPHKGTAIYKTAAALFSGGGA